MSSRATTADQENLRFRFGKNWSRFLRSLNDKRIKEAERSLVLMLGVKNLEGLRFLDAGTGSGLFSLAALNLGANQVTSFDYDADSVACAEYLNEKYGPFTNWDISRGSVLDTAWMDSLGKYDVVYSWGVLHHTGDMWRAMEEIAKRVRPGGLLYISIYNHRGLVTRGWSYIKRLYNAAPAPIRLIMGNAYFLWTASARVLAGTVRNTLSRDASSHSVSRGMSAYYDAIDWIGGYPYEAAKPEEVFHFYRDRGFVLHEMNIKRGLGCNEFVFTLTASDD